MENLPAQIKTISVVMATYNRADILQRTLAHLARQDIAPELIELIVVNDGSTDNTAELAKELLPKLPFKTSYLEHENRGPGYTQNRGLRAATGDIVMLMADDIFLAPQCVRAHLEFHQSNIGLEYGALGKTYNSSEMNQTAFLRQAETFWLGRYSDGERLPYYRFWAFNISVKRQFMLTKGLFLEHSGRAGPAAHEDTELGYRLAQSGLELIFLGAAQACHYHPWTLAQARARHYMRGLNYGEFRDHVPDPEMSVVFRVFDLDTLSDYRVTLGGKNHLRGKQKYWSWHLFRYLLSSAFFNEFTARAIWPTVFGMAERSKIVERCMHKSFYAHYLHVFFLRGVKDAKRLYACTDGGGSREEHEYS